MNREQAAAALRNDYPYHSPIGERTERLVLSEDDEIVVEALDDGRIRLTVDNVRWSSNLEYRGSITLTHSQAREVYYLLHRITGGDYSDGL